MLGCPLHARGPATWQRLKPLLRIIARPGFPLCLLCKAPPRCRAGAEGLPRTRHPPAATRTQQQPKATPPRSRALLAQRVEARGSNCGAAVFRTVHTRSAHRPCARDKSDDPGVRHVQKGRSKLHIGMDGLHRKTDPMCNLGRPFCTCTEREGSMGNAFENAFQVGRRLKPSLRAFVAEVMRVERRQQGHR